MESGKENKGKSDNERKEEIVKSMLLWLKSGAIGREQGFSMEEVPKGTRQGRLGLGASMTRMSKRSFFERRECKKKQIYPKAQNYVRAFM